MQLTYRFRVKDKHIARLKAQAAAVNLVWKVRPEGADNQWRKNPPR
jgi:hypothetical protein